ncbi:MAG TPA: hypothetical protein VFZ67_06240 [Nitrososphaera sp.]|jgi:hypothetical protein
MKREDVDAMNAILRLPSDMQVWEMQQQRRKPVFTSASLSAANAVNRVKCTRCGGLAHKAIECPFAPYNLLRD